MRRIIGFVLLGLGVFAVALGLLLRLYAYPRLAKVPVDVNTTVNAEGTNATALMFVKQPSGVTLPEIKTGLNLKVERRVQGDLTQPEVVKDGNVVSWREGVNVVDSVSGNAVSTTERQLCLDRRTNEAVQPCTTMYVQNKVDAAYQPVREDNTFQPGISLKFPFATEKHSYQMYDLNLRDSAEARFDGEDQLNGLEVYRFVQDIPPTKLESGRKVPGTLLGKSDPVVSADLYYKNKRTVWVEPVTGQIIKGQEQQFQELREPGEETGTAVFDGTLTFTDQTVRKNVTDAEDNKSKLALLTTLPVILWIVGTVVIVAAVALLLWGGRLGARRTEPEPPQQRQLADAAS